MPDGSGGMPRMSLADDAAGCAGVGEIVPPLPNPPPLEPQRPSAAALSDSASMEGILGIRPIPGPLVSGTVKRGGGVGWGVGRLLLLPPPPVPAHRFSAACRRSDGCAGQSVEGE
jgi:hypothetical protein